MTTTDRLTFEGFEVDSVQIRITNAGDGLTEALQINPKALHIGDDFACVLRGKVTQVNHKEGKDDSTIRLHTVKTTGITEVDLDMAKRILGANAESLARAKADREGQLQLEADEDLEGQEALAQINEGGLGPEFKAPTQ